MLTIPMIDYIGSLGPHRYTVWSFSIAKYGPQTGYDQYFTDAGNGVSITNNTLITWNDKTDAYTNVNTNFQMGFHKISGYLLITFGSLYAVRNHGLITNQ